MEKQNRLFYLDIPFIKGCFLYLVLWKIIYVKIVKTLAVS